MTDLPPIVRAPLDDPSFERERQRAQAHIAEHDSEGDAPTREDGDTAAEALKGPSSGGCRPSPSVPYVHMHPIMERVDPLPGPQHSPDLYRLTRAQNWAKDRLKALHLDEYVRLVAEELARDPKVASRVDVDTKEPTDG